MIDSKLWKHLLWILKGRVHVSHHRNRFIVLDWGKLSCSLMRYFLDIFWIVWYFILSFAAFLYIIEAKLLVWPLSREIIFVYLWINGVLDLEVLRGYLGCWCLVLNSACYVMILSNVLHCRFDIHLILNFSSFVTHSKLIYKNLILFWIHSRMIDHFW